jgi:hypothetical protein
VKRADLSDPNTLPGKYAAHVELASADADAPAARDQDGEVVEARFLRGCLMRPGDDATSD